ncbi:phage tail tape measure protein [Edwardsiella piscicida]|uniref:phage tail tape measure protein n=1 Tax=Edwardsiella piscicida TaxID=1263550 RepID=UPI00101ABA83|nr:phage tail tape measure protein [Edwardsiella piscicida]ELM3734797.1 phage tail tape measure protein [Edwardsiella piscicida]QBB14241.1 phage tail protein [Edwardsiella piscicida]WGS78515.1 phage tail tape measure protein [Edwardsiella piscicida]WGS81900.1 phage tail tape measure protein [Edwardsiella piscicida]
MASRLTTEILINLAGNLTAKARQYGSNMSEFARRNERAMSIVKATSAAAGRGLDALGNRYTGLIAGFATGATVKGVADFDAQMRRMGTDAQLTQEQVSALHQQIRDVSNQSDIRIDASVLGQGASELLGKTGDYQYVQDNLRNMGVLMQAFGVDGQTAAGLMAQFWEKGVKGSSDVSKMLDKLYAQFAVGSVSVADIAKVAPKLFSIVQDQGPLAIAQMGAFAQVFAKNKGSADETVTSIQAMYAALSNKKNIDFLKHNGVDVFKKGTKELKLPFELMKEILNRAKNDPIKLQDVFDQTGMQGINSLLKPENIRLMNELIYGTVEYGATQKAAKTNAEGFNAAMQSLNNEWQRFAESQLAKPVQELADALNSVDHDTADRWLNIGKNIAYTGAAIIAARKAFQLGKGALDILGVGKGKGIPTGVADVFGSGVMPVYVTNMPANGISGSNDTNSPEIPSKKNKYNKGGLVGAAINTYAEIKQLIPFPENDKEKAEFIKRVTDNANRRTMWDDIKDWFNSAGNDSQITNPQPWANLQSQNKALAYPTIPPSLLKGEIRVIVEGDARVKSVKMDQPGITLSAQSGVSNVEQN